MMLLGIGIKRHDLAMGERLHKRNARQHRVASAAAQQKRFDRYLPVRKFGFLLRQLGDVVRRVLQRKQLPAVGQNDGIVKLGRPGQIIVSGNGS